VSELSELTHSIKELVHRVDGLICHYTSIDADYSRVRNTLVDHEERIRRLEREHNFEPAKKIGEDSALFQVIKS